MKVAIVGTRQPTESQIQYVHEFISGLDSNTVIISGCARGIDTEALKCARQRKLKTVCYVPFKKQFGFADEVITLSSVPDELRKEVVPIGWTVFALV